MKTTILIALTVLTTAALPIPFVTQNNCEPMAQKVVAALRTSSPDAYVALFPSLDEFYMIIDENALVYGENLANAKTEFADQYNSKLIPSLKKSFASILQQGKNKGIDWSKITFERVVCTTSGENLASAPLTIVFSVNKKEYHITIDKAFVLHGVWKVSAEMSLI